MVLSDLSSAPFDRIDGLRRLCMRDPSLAPLSIRSIGDSPLSSAIRALGDDAWWMNPLHASPLWFVRAARFDPRTLQCAVRSIAREAPGASAVVIAERVDAVGYGVAVSVDGGRSARAWTGRLDALDDAGRAVIDLIWTAQSNALRADALDRELVRRDVDARFFVELTRVVDGLAAAFEGVPFEATDDRRSLALLLVIRWMFLAFVEQKGWLASDRSLLARLTLDPDARSLYRTRLRPLFFEALNAPAGHRPAGLEGVPYLNGGLFAPDPVEMRYPDLDLPDDAVRGMQRRLFEAFRFVGRDGDGSHAIRPTMLGTAFERLMGEEVRSRTGAFYTPPDLVDLVVDDAVDVWLAHRLGASIARAVGCGDPDSLSRADAARVITALDDLRVLDPAVGSGAFLLGVYEALVRRRAVALGVLGADDPRGASTHAVVARCLHGVDLSPTAVRLCELRLWLRIVAEADDGVASAEPLPNLGHRLVVGDSLMPLAWRTARSSRSLPRELVARRADIAVRLVSAHGEERARLAESLACIEQDLGRRLSRARVRDLTDEVRRWRRLEQSHDLFGAVRGLDRGESACADRARASLDEARDASRMFRTHGHALAFDPGVHFAEVIARGGFDLIVGNPPWVRMSDLPRDDRDRVRARFAWMGDYGAPPGRAFGSQPDLSVAFVEQAWRMTREGGVVGMLVPGKVFTADYGAPMRAALRAEATVCTARDLSRRGTAWLDADAYPAALVARRGGSVDTIRIELPSGAVANVRPEHLAATKDPGAPWPGLDDEGMRLYRRLRASGRPLGRVTAVRMGVKTGLNRAFVNPPDDVEPCVPVVRGRDVSALDIETSGRLLFAHDPATGELLASVSPRALVWLDQHGEALDRRSDRRASDPRWRLFRVRREALGHRVVWSDLARHLAAAPLAPVTSGGPVVLNSAFTAAVDSSRDALRLAAWLCALPAAVVASCVAEPARSGFRRYRARHMSTVPVPAVLFDRDDSRARRFEAATERLLADRDDEDAWAGLDHAAAVLAGLSSPEAASLRRLGAALGLDVGRGPGLVR